MVVMVMTLEHTLEVVVVVLLIPARMLHLL